MLAVITVMDNVMHALQQAGDPELQRIFEDLQVRQGAQEASPSVLDNPVLTGPLESSPDALIVQEPPQRPKERSLKRKASASTGGPIPKKGVRKRTLKGAIQKNTGENTRNAKEAAKPLRDITMTVQNAEAAAKGVSRRVGQDKLFTYYSHIQQRTGKLVKCQALPDSNLFNAPTGMSILHRSGDIGGTGFTTPAPVRPAVCKSKEVNLNSSKPCLKKKQEP